MTPGEARIAQVLRDLLQNAEGDDLPSDITAVESWQEAGVLSRDAGFRITTARGRVYDVTITEGRR